MTSAEKALVVCAAAIVLLCGAVAGLAVGVLSLRADLNDKERQVQLWKEDADFWLDQWLALIERKP